MDSSLLLRVGRVARASGLFSKSHYPLSRLTSPVIAPSFVAIRGAFTAPSLLLPLGIREHKPLSSVSGFTCPPWAGHGTLSTRSKRTQSLPTSETEDEDIHVRFITDSSEDDDDEEEEVYEEAGYGDGRRPSLYAEVFDPFIHKTSFGQLLQYIDLLNENQALKRSQGGVTEELSGGRGVTAEEDDEAVHLWVSMPGLGKEDVKVCLEKDVLTMKGERNDVAGKKFKYCKKVKLSSQVCKVNDIKAEMMNGVLKVVVPKLKEEERKDVIRFPVN